MFLSCPFQNLLREIRYAFLRKVQETFYFLHENYPQLVYQFFCIAKGCWQLLQQTIRFQQVVKWQRVMLRLLKQLVRVVQ